MDKPLLTRKRSFGSLCDLADPPVGNLDELLFPKKHHKRAGKGWAYFDYLIVPLKKDPHPFDLTPYESDSNETAAMFQARRRASIEQSFIPPIRSVSDSVDQSARGMASFQQPLLPNKHDQHPSDPIRSVMTYTTDKSLVIDRVDEILSGAPSGFPMTALPEVEHLFNPLDFELFGVRNLQELVVELGKQKKVVLLERPEKKETFAMAVTVANGLLSFLRPYIEQLLNKYDEIPFSSFDKYFMDTHQFEWNSFHFGLTGLDHLCRDLEDIVKVEVNSSGNTVMKLKDSVTDQDPQFKKKEEKSNEKISGSQDV